MKLLLSLITAICLAAPVAANTPEDVLNSWQQILVQRDFKDIGEIMDKEDMAEMKVLILAAMRQQRNKGRFDLQRTIFGKKVTRRFALDTDEKFYLRRLAAQILSAANANNFKVEKIDLLGHVAEGEDKEHYVARVYLSQDGKEGNYIRVYSLVKHDGVWKMKFPEIVRGMLQVIEAGMMRDQLTN